MTFPTVTVFPNGIATNNTPRILSSSGAASSVTGTTAETVLVSVPVPPMGPRDGLRVTFVLSNTNNANTKTVRGRLSGIGGTPYPAWAATTNGVTRYCFDIYNNNATNSQKGWASSSAFGGTSGLGNGAADTTQPTTLVLTGQLQVGTDTMAIEYYTVELLPGS